MKRNPEGKFLATPKGVKTPKMLEVEKKLGRTLEKDYKENYLYGPLGQKRLADRWNVPRNLIFAKSLRGKRRSWTKMLNLQVKRENLSESGRNHVKGCEICLKNDVLLDKAHWVDRAKGGSDKSFNILKLCPNCHRKLDTGDQKVIKDACRVLLFREVKKLIEESGDEYSKKNRLVELCRAILNRKSIP